MAELMDVDAIQTAFRARLSDQVRLDPVGHDRFRVYTPFSFADGDAFGVVLRRDGDEWVLSDEGSTYMHLTYDMDDKDFSSGTRAKIIANTLALYQVQERQGELVLPVADAASGDSLFDFVQALSRIADVTFLTRERVRSVFLQDVRSFVVTKIPASARHVDWHHPEYDPQGNYPADYRIDGRDRPVFVFALPGDDKVRDVTITLHQYREWGIRALSVGIFEDQEEIGRKVLARFSDIVDKQFSSFAGANRQWIDAYLAEVVRA